MSAFVGSVYFLWIFSWVGCFDFYKYFVVCFLGMFGSLRSSGLQIKIFSHEMALVVLILKKAFADLIVGDVFSRMRKL